MATTRKSLLYISVYSGLIALLISACASPRSASVGSSGGVYQRGTASWYGPKFHGRQTANGERFNMRKLTAAHRTLPFNTVVKVVNKNNGKSVTVRINDRGPFAKGRIIDLSKAAAEKVNMIGTGTAPVELYILKRSNSSGSSAPSAGSNAYADPDKGSFTIQIASFEKRNHAVRKAASIRGARVKKVRVDGDKIFRVYYGEYNSRKKADKDLKKLKKRGVSGFIKSL